MTEQVQLQHVQHVEQQQLQFLPTVISIIHIPSTAEQDEETMDDVLPQGSVIVSSEEYRVLIRCPIKDRNDWNTWLETFQQKTKTSWISRSCRKPSGHFTLSKDYVCHHSSHGKIKTSTKSCDCQAWIKVRIKRNNKFTRLRDPHVKAGRLGIVKLNILHNHEINEAALSYLPPSSTTRSTFEQYFVNGMKPVEASKYHMEFIKKNTADWKTALANASIFPYVRTVNWWYEVWKKAGIPPAPPELNTEIPSETVGTISLTEEGAVEPIRVIECDQCHQEEPLPEPEIPIDVFAQEVVTECETRTSNNIPSEESANLNPLSQASSPDNVTLPEVEVEISDNSFICIPFSTVLYKLAAMDNHFGTNQEEIRKFIYNLDSISTKSEWDNFVHQGFGAINQVQSEILVDVFPQEVVTESETHTSNTTASEESVHLNLLSQASSPDNVQNEISSIPSQKSRIRKQPKFKDSSNLKRAKSK